jgi:uncharacterized protein
MKLEVATWPEGTTAKELAEKPEDLDLSAELTRFEEPVRVQLTVQKSSDEVIISGRVATRAQATCVRCLEGFPVSLDAELRRVANVVPDKQVGDDTGDPDFIFLPESLPVWNVSEVLREVILLALPDNPVCRENCRGLCPGCGANLNSGQCRCERPQTQGSLSQLSQLLEQRKSRTATGGDPD